MNELTGLAWLLVCQSAGEILSRGLHLRLPGPVLGMLILLLALRWRSVRDPVSKTADMLLAHLSLLFVPVGLGVITHTGLIAQYGIRILLVLVLSTWIGLAITALTLRLLLRRGTAPGAG